MEKLNIVYLSIGTNLGNKTQNLKQMINAFRQAPHVEVLAISDVFETSPVGGIQQDNFYNMAIKICTTYSANELLDQIHGIENQLKRIRKIRWGPRTADIDILTFNDQQISSTDLTVPHPEMLKRLFVLEPLLQITHSAFYNYEELKHAEQIVKMQTDQKIINRGSLK